MQTIRVKWLRRDLFVEPLGWIAARLAVLCRFPKMLCGRDPEFPAFGCIQINAT